MSDAREAPPDRVQPLTVAEQEIATAQLEGDGVTLIAQVGGYGGSSTRAELAAGIVALASDRPVHLGSDSQAFLMKAKAVQAMVVDKQQPKRPFAAQRDGDLWSHFYSALHARGPHSVCFTKVKGHATKQQVEAGEVRMQDKIGNDAADQAAEEGVQTFGAKLARLAARLQDRHRSYSVFMQHLQERLVRFYEARYQLRQEMDARAPSRRRRP